MSHNRKSKIGFHCSWSAVTSALGMLLLLSVSTVGVARAKEKPPFVAEVVSSAPDQVTGGDARLHIQVPQVVPLQQVEIWVNGVNQADRFALIDGTRTLTGVVDGHLRTRGLARQASQSRQENGG